MFLLTYTFQRSFMPNPKAAAQRHVTALPAVISIHTAMDHYTSVMPYHLRVGEDWDGATFSWENNGND